MNCPTCTLITYATVNGKPFCLNCQKGFVATTLPSVAPDPHLSKKSTLEVRFEAQWALYGEGEWEYDQRIFPDRKFRTDYLDRASRVVVEVEGYGHQQQNRYYSDEYKYNRLSEENWSLFRITSKTLKDDQKTRTFIEMVCAVRKERAP